MVGDDRGLLNYLASLVVSGNLELERLYNLMHRQPWEDLEVVVDRRRSTLDGASTGKRHQTLDRWREDAVQHLTECLGEWLEEGDLPVTRWKKYKGEWNRYRRDVLEETFGDQPWVGLFQQISERDLKQIGPRLDTGILADSLVGLRPARRETVYETLPEPLVEKLQADHRSSVDRRDVLEGRKNVFEQGRDVVSSMYYPLDGSWSLQTEDD